MAKAIHVAYAAADHMVTLTSSTEEFIAACSELWNVPPSCIVGVAAEEDLENVLPIYAIHTIASYKPQETLYLACLSDVEDVSQLPALSFNLMPEGSLEMQMHWRDLYRLHFLHSNTELSSWNVQDLVPLFLDNCDTKNRIPLSAFVDIIRVLVPGDKLPRTTRLYISRVLIDAFRWLSSGSIASDEANSVGGVYVLDALALVAIFCGGKKSDKLLDIWTATSTISTHNDDNKATSLTKRQVWRFLRALMHPLVFFSSTALQMPREEATTLLDDAALQPATQLFRLQNSTHVDFAEFGEFYNAASRDLLWLEMYDCTKWPIASLELHAVADSESDESERAEVPANTTPENTAQEDTAPVSDDQPVIQILLSDQDEFATESLGMPACLSISRADVRSHQRFLSVSALPTMDATQLIEQVRTYIPVSSDCVLDANGLDLVIAAVVDGMQLSDVQIATVVKTVYALAHLLGVESGADNTSPSGEVVPWEPSVHLLDVLIALLFFVRGSKTDKLMAAFGLLSERPAPAITRRETWRLARAFLCSVTLFSDSHWQNIMDGVLAFEDLAELSVFIDVASLDVAASIFVGTHRSQSHTVTFDELAHFYNQQLTETNGQHNSFESLAWFELLDASKWADLCGPQGTARRVELTINGQPIGEAIEADSASHVATESKRPVFVYDVVGSAPGFDFDVTAPMSSDALVGHYRSLRLSNRACQFVHFVSQCSGLGSLNPEELRRAVFHAVAGGPRLSLEEYVRMLPSVLPPDTIMQAARMPLSAFFLRLFEALDFEGISAVWVVDVTMALSLFVGGSKSDKLALAFSLYGKNPTHASGLGNIMRKTDFYRFLRAFFGCLCVVQEQGAELDVLSQQLQNPLQFRVRLRTAAERTRVTETIAQNHSNQFFTLLAPARTMDFDRLSTVYNMGGGYDVAPYFELFSLRKWGSDAESTVQECLHYFASVYPSGTREDGNHKGIFQFSLQGDGSDLALQVTQSACDAVHRLSRLTSLGSLGADELLVAVRAGPTVSRVQFVDLVEKLFLRYDDAGPSREDREWATGCLHMLYDCLDADAVGSVDSTELAAMLMVFTRGKKSEKLAILWDMLSDSSSLQPYLLVSVIRSWLLSMLAITTLVAISDQVGSSPEAARHAFATFRHDMQTAYDAATDIAERIVRELSANGAAISYHSFADWYNRRGMDSSQRASMPWLELIDLTKWPKSETDEAAGGRQSSDASSRDAVYRFEIAPSAQRPVSITITASDIERLANFISATGFTHLEPADVFVALASQCDEDDFIHERGWRAACMELFAIMNSTEDARLKIADELMAFFNRFDVEGLGRASPLQLALGLSNFTAGSKSQKLAFAWQLFASPGEHEKTDAASVQELCEILFSILSSVTHFSSSKVSSWEVSPSRLLQAARQLAMQIFIEMFPTDDWADRRLSFEDFSRWYNGNLGTAGHQVVPFIELMDIKKWLEASHGDQGMVSPADEIVFGFLLTVEGDTMKVTRRDIMAFQFFIETTGLSRVAAKEIFVTIAQHVNADGEVAREAFLAVLRAMAGKATQQDDVDSVQLTDDVMAYLFDTFDSTGRGAVAAADLATAVSIMTQGSKSQKLLLAFNAYVTANHSEGKMQPAMMVQFIRSVVLGMLTFAHAESDGGNRYRQSIWSIADRCASEVTHMVFSNDDAPISFEQFAEFYNTTGFHVAGFLELLNPDRWRFPGDSTERSEGSAASTPHTSQSQDDTRSFFQFKPPSHLQLDYDVQTSLTIRQEDLLHYRSVLSASGFHTVPHGKLYEAAFFNADDELMSKALFNKILRGFVNSSSAHQDEKHLLSFALSSVFYALDTQDTSVISADEAAAALASLFSGNTIEKLSSAWNVFDLDADGALSFGELVRLLRALLTGILALRAPDEPLDSEHCSADAVPEGDPRLTYVDGEVVHSMAIDMANRVFGNNGDHSLTVTFDAFWRHADGDADFDWLTLIDPSAWLDPQSSSPCLEFSLGDQQLLLVRPEDAKNILRISSTSGLCERTLPELQATLQSFADREQSGALVVSEGGFRAVLAAIEPKGVTTAERAYAELELLRLHFLLEDLQNRNGDGVFLECLLLGLMPLCAGSKSEKFVAAFDLLGQNGQLSGKQLEIMLACILGALFALRTAEHIKSETDAEKRAQASLPHICHDYVENILTWDGQTQHQVNFNQFSLWYNKVGSETCSFIELLSLSKLSAFSKDGSALESVECELEAPLSFADLSAALEFVQKMDFCSVMPTDFLALMNGDVATVVGSTSYGKSFIACLDASFRQAGLVPTVERVLLASLVLCGGDKSAKLSAAWRLATGRHAETDSPTRVGVTIMQLRDLLFCLLIGVCALSDLFRTAATSSPPHMLDQIGRVAKAIFAATQSTDSIGFSTFGSWYNEDGYRLIPWLELINVDKWESVLHMPAPDLQHRPSFYVHLPVGDGVDLLVTKDDGNRLRQLSVALGLSTAPCQHLLVNFPKKLTVTAEDLSQFLTAKGSPLADGARDALRALCGSQGEVDADVAACTLLIYSDGTKSDKIYEGLRHAESLNGGSISKAALRTLVISMGISVLNHLQSVGADRRTSLEGLLEDLTERFLQALPDDVNGDVATAFHAFSNFYNEEGHRLLPFLELLDTKKWPTR